MKEIASAFVKAQKAFGPALKTATNPHFRTRYADLSACVEAVIDALNSNGIALIQQSSECTDGVIVETVFIHESGETLSSGKLHVPAAKNDPQGYGSALTYARRYSLMAACGIAPEDDDGNAASKSKRAPGQQPAGVSNNPREGIGEDMPADWKAFLKDAADYIKSLCEEGKPGDAVFYLEQQKLEADQETYMWGLLPPKFRSMIKTAKAIPR